MSETKEDLGIFKTFRQLFNSSSKTLEVEKEHRIQTLEREFVIKNNLINEQNKILEEQNKLLKKQNELLNGQDELIYKCKEIAINAILNQIIYIQKSLEKIDQRINLLTNISIKIAYIGVGLWLFSLYFTLYRWEEIFKVQMGEIAYTALKSTVIIMMSLLGFNLNRSLKISYRIKRIINLSFRWLLYRQTLKKLNADFERVEKDIATLVNIKNEY